MPEHARILNQSWPGAIIIEQLVQWLGFRLVSYVRWLFKTHWCQTVMTVQLHQRQPSRRSNKNGHYWYRSLFTNDTHQRAAVIADLVPLSKTFQGRW